MSHDASESSEPPPASSGGGEGRDPAAREAVAAYGTTEDAGGASEDGATSGAAASCGTAHAEPVVGADTTVVAVGTSVTWCSGNHYAHKFPNLVHRDLNGGYSMDETYLHFNEGGTVSGPNEPTPAYHAKTLDDGYTDPVHPCGPPIPPVQYRARGGAIIGLSRPAKTMFGTDWSEIGRNDNGGYLASGADGDYDGKLDFVHEYRHLFEPANVDRTVWSMMRDIGWGWPTIVDQMEQFQHRGQPKNSLDVPSGNVRQFGGKQPESRPPDAEDVDVVLIDGGTNDIDLSWLNDPSQAGRHEIWQAVRRHQYDDVVGSDGLLQRARRRFPNAVVVLVGEPVWASNRTDHRRARKFLVESAAIAGVIPGVVEQAIDNALNFSRFSAYWLRRAAAEEARDDDGPGIVFAMPGYGVVNSMMADWPWSFGFEPNGEANGYSTDENWELRRKVCLKEQNWENRTAGEPREIDLVGCLAAGIGHPNPEGCRQIADSIVRRYKRHVHLHTDEVSEILDGGTDSLRRSFGRYGLDLGADGVRYCSSHRVVDSIRTKFWTATGSGKGQKKGRLYLRVYPGRTGSGERFRLDSEYNDLQPGGPTQTPDSDYAEDEFHVDPMMGRRLAGPPGNTDAHEQVGSKENERTLQTYHQGDRWDDQRLELGDVEHATLWLEGVDSGDGWDLERIALGLNGLLNRTQTYGRFDRTDTRCTGGSDVREFVIASNNDVDGVSADDVDVEIAENRLSLSFSSGVASLEMSVDVTNDADVRLPGVAIECGLRARKPLGDLSGRDWQVHQAGTLGPGESKRVRVELRTEEAGHVRTNNDLDVVASAFVGTARASDTVRTNRRGIQS